MRRWLLTIAILLPTVLSAGFPQKSGNSDIQYDLKKCRPKLLREKPAPEPKNFKLRKTDKPSGYDPVIAFDILESGEVVNARVARSSGVADQDAQALAWIRGWRFNGRPGCGTIEQTAHVTIDLR
jgi:TonB family protein